MFRNLCEDVANGDCLPHVRKTLCLSVRLATCIKDILNGRIVVNNYIWDFYNIFSQYSNFS
jgi:hypothetical protein